MNLHPRCYHYDTVACSGRQPSINVQCCVDNWLNFATIGGVFHKSCEVKIVQHDYGVSNMGANGNGGIGGKKRYIYSSFLVQLVKYDNFDSYPAFCWFTNTKWPSLHLAQPPGTS